MKAPTIHLQRSIAWLVAAVMGFVAAPAMTAVNTIPASKRTLESHANAASQFQASASSLATADATTRLKVSEAYDRALLSFEPNLGQADARVKFLSRGNAYNLFLTSTAATFAFLRTQTLGRGPANKEMPDWMRAPIYSQPQVDNDQTATLRISLLGASEAVKETGLDELPGKSNYFIGKDPKKWRVNVPTYSGVKFQDVYPGVDLLYYGKQRQVECDFIVAPGASFKPIRMAFDGARRIRLDHSGDLLIETSIGEIRQHKPVIYQEAAAVKQPVGGGYVITGEREVGFEVGAYDPSGALVIDPVFAYSTSIGGFYNDNANAVAVDAAGNAYVTGMTTSTDFPTVNPFQPNLRIGVTIGIPSEAFVTKLNASGTTVLYSTYLGGGRNDTANAIAVDDEGNAYLTGYTASDDFPTTPDAFQTKSSAGGDAFVTKLSPTGNALVYSTRLGGPGPSLFRPSTNVGRGIAVGAEGSTYVTGYTLSPTFPTKKAAQGQFNRGASINCCFECLYNFAPGPSPLEDAFVTKLNPSGTGLVYSTYLGGVGQDEANAIAVDPSGSAYVTGRTCSRDFASASYGSGASDAFVVKLGPSGRQFEYSRLLGGSGDDVGNGVAVDLNGNAYITGQTDSINFPTTQSAFQPGLGGSVSYVTIDGGASWNPGTGLPNSPVNVVATDPANPSTIYAGLGNCSTKAGGVYKSTDGGNTWRFSGLERQIIQGIAVDPKQSSIVYAGTHKSTDGGGTWNQINNFGPIGELTIDPVTPTTIYAISNGLQCGDGIIGPSFEKSTDGGSTWSLVRPRNGEFFITPDSVVIDPKNHSTLYAVRANLYKSTDGGNNWRVPYEGNRNFVRIAIDPIITSTLYLSDPSGNLLKTTDGGITFSTLGSIGFAINELLVDPTNSATLYAATGIIGHGGGVFKSIDGGQTWKATDLVAVTVNALAINPLNPSRVYAGVAFDVDSFVVKSDPTGSAFLFSTYLGSRSSDTATSIGVDETGNAYMTGSTLSDRFPSKDALQPRKPSGPFDTATFTTKLNTTGSAILFSTYVGGNEPSSGSGIAVDPAGKVYIAGTTGTFQPVPTATSAESVHGGFDAFVIKIVSPPRVAGVSVSGKNLVVTGEAFDKGAVILIDGVEQRTRNDESTPASVLTGKKSAKNIAPGQRVVIQVRSSDGLLSGAFEFTRAAQ